MMTNNSNQHLHYLGFERALPSTSLQSCVMNYWMIKRCSVLSDIHYEYLHPDGGLGLVFNLGDAFIFDGIELKNTHYLDGTHTTSTMLGLQGNIHAIGIRFLPGGGYPFLTESLIDVSNHTINIEDLNLKNLNLLYQQLHLAQSMNQVSTVLEQWLINIYSEQFQTSKIISESVKIIQQTTGHISINHLTSHLNMSQRQLERLFKAQVGMSPKKLARIIRINHARKQLVKSYQSGNKVFSHLQGFYDQAHFIREFQSIIGKNPSDYLNRKMNKLNNLKLNQAF